MHPKDADGIANSVDPDPVDPDQTAQPLKKNILISF